MICRLTATLAALCAAGGLAAQSAADPGKGISIFVSSIELDSGNTVAYTGPVSPGESGFVSGDQYARAGTIATATAQFGYLNRTPAPVDSAIFTLVRNGYNTGVVMEGALGEAGIEYRANPADLRVRYDGTFNAVLNLNFDEYTDPTKQNTKRVGKTSTASNLEGKLKPKLRRVEKDTSAGAPTGGLVAKFVYDANWTTAITYPITAKVNRITIDGSVRNLARPTVFSAGLGKGEFSVKFVRGQKVRWHLDGWYDEASVEDMTPGLGNLTLTPTIPSPRTTYARCTIRSVASTPSPFTVGQVLPSWCADSQTAMAFGSNRIYSARALSTLALPANSLPPIGHRSELSLTQAQQAALTPQERLNVANWLINNSGSSPMADVQRAIWLILGQPAGGDLPGYTASSIALANQALGTTAARSFLPSPATGTQPAQQFLILFTGGGGLGEPPPVAQGQLGKVELFSLEPAAPVFGG